MASPAEAARLLAAEHPEIAWGMEVFGPARFGRRPKVDERFGRLVRSITGQQLSVAAARTIHGRLCDLVGDPSPASILDRSPDEFRSCGLSNAKAVALGDLAARVDDGRLDLAKLGRSSDTDVIDTLTEVKGVGPWTAQMFLLGVLHRLDVWPTGDAGVRNGFAVLTGRNGPPNADELEDLGDRYQPYRSVVAWYCWRFLDNNPNTQ